MMAIASTVGNVPVKGNEDKGLRGGRASDEGGHIRARRNAL